MRAIARTSLVTCLVLAAVRTSAQGPPQSAAQPARSVTTRFTDNRLEIRDARSGAPIFITRAPMTAGQGQGVTSAIRCKEHPDGADLVVNFMNPSPEPRAAGSIVLGSFTLGQSISYYDLRDTSQAVAVDYHTFLPKSFTYPGELYSPAWVLANENYAVGISVQYPVLDYRHDARLTLLSPTPEDPGIEGGRGWSAVFQFSDAATPGAPVTVQHPALIKPRDVLTYTISIRVTAKPKEWARTLVPYREFFRGAYGGVRYLRRADPVQAVVVAESAKVSDESPLGFLEPFRPDTNGWARLSRYLRNETGDCNRAVLVNPSGLYRFHREFNPPFQMTSAWAATAPLAAAEERYDGLPAVATAGKDLGLWWGNACRVSKAWDPTAAEPLNPANAEHVRLALAELDGAVRAGATTVVLGNFRHEITPVWVLAGWLETLSARYPDVRLVTDPSACDLLHRLAPTYVQGWNDTTTARREADLYTVKGPNTIADFLLPGHETWAGFNYENPKQALKIMAEPARVRADMERYAGFGYVPCFFWTGRLDGSIAAAPTWTTSLPPDLVLNDVPVPPAVATGGAPAAAGPGVAPQAAGAPAAPSGPALPRTGAKVTVQPASAPVKNAPNEGKVRPGKGEVTDAIRRAGATSAKAATKASQIGPTKVASPETPPKKPER